MFRSVTIFRELILNLAKVIFILKHSVKLRRYMLFGDVAACHIAECVLCVVHSPCAFVLDTVSLFPLQGQLKRRFQFILEEIMLQYAYPRLDINVTKGLNHLLKSPFCVHPKTGKVCLPFHPRAAEKFDPCSVPTIR
jgi:hypothetical protein